MKQIGIKIIKRGMIQAAVLAPPTNKGINQLRATQENERQIVRRIRDWVRMGRERRRSEEVESLRLYFCIGERLSLEHG